MRVSVDDPGANREDVWMRVSPQIRRSNAGQRKHVMSEIGGLFGLSTQNWWVIWPKYRLRRCYIHVMDILRGS